MFFIFQKKTTIAICFGEKKQTHSVYMYCEVNLRKYMQ